MAKVLCVDRENEGDTYHPWNEETKKRFKLDAEDVEYIEDDNVLWRGSVAFSLEEEEEE